MAVNLRDIVAGVVPVARAAAPERSELSEELKGYQGEPYAMNGLLIVPFTFPRSRMDEVLPQLAQLGNVAYIEDNQCWPIQPRLADEAVSRPPVYPTQALRFE